MTSLKAESKTNQLGRKFLRSSKGVLFLLTAFLILGCGGGSAGTGESESVGEVVDCYGMPLANVNLLKVGIFVGREQFSDANGSFVLESDAQGMIEIPTPEGSTLVPAWDPVCVILVTGNSMATVDSQVSQTLIYPRTALKRCSLEEVQQNFPNASPIICSD